MPDSDVPQVGTPLYLSDEARLTAAWPAIVGEGDTSSRMQRSGGSNAVEFAYTSLPVPGLVSSFFGRVGVSDGRRHHVAGMFDGARLCL